jgi:hypothetical protein
MTLQIDTSDSIIIDGRDTGLKITQRQNGTIIYTPESTLSGKKYREHAMPYNRYSAAHDAPCKPLQAYDPNISAGRLQLEADIKSLLGKLG